MIPFRHNSRWARLTWLTVVGVFIADWLLPNRFDIVFAYLLAHFMAIYFKEKSDVLLLAVITTALTVIGGVLKPQEAPMSQVMLERVPPIISFWAAAFFVVRYMMLREEETENEERFRALFEVASSGILLSDQKGTIVMANPAAEGLFGYTPGELLGQSVDVLVPKHLSHRHSTHRQDYLQRPQPRSMGTGLELYGLRKDGTTLPVEISLSPFATRKQSFVMAFVIDNTYRKSYETSILKQRQELANLSEALKELNEQLEIKVVNRTAELEQAKNDLASALDKERELGELKSRFVSMASHEFRTPLTSILSSASLIHQYADRQDLSNVKKHADRIKNAVTSLNSILTEFLSLGRLDEGRMSIQAAPVSLRDCVADVHESMKSLFKLGQVFEYQHTGEEMASIDPNLFKNILINLLSNAIKYSPTEALIRVVSRVQEGRIRLSVQDQGMGIPEAEQKHLFERFFRASNAVNTTQGTGLGLYIVQRYAEMMGGSIGFSSEVEQGSEFWLDAPIQTGQA